MEGACLVWGFGVGGLLFIVYCLLLIVHSLLCIVHCILFIVHNLLCSVYLSRNNCRLIINNYRLIMNNYRLPAAAAPSAPARGFAAASENASWQMILNWEYVSFTLRTWSRV